MTDRNGTLQAARRVVVTGCGVVSSLGCSLETVRSSLEESRSGIVHCDDWRELGLRSHVAGDITSRPDWEPRLARSAVGSRQLETMGPVASLCVLACEDALAAAGLGPDRSADGRLGAADFACVVGSGVSSMRTIHEGTEMLFSGRARRIRPWAILQGMSSTVSAHLVRTFGFGGRSYSLSSACSTSSHSIGHAFELIRGGLAERAVAGGGDEVSVITGAGFNALRTALSSGFNDRPAEASRPFDAARDGFVLSGGAGVLVLESLDSARGRGVEPLMEILGFAANSDDHDMVLPEPEGLAAGRCMVAALRDAGLEPADVDYVNAHATGTPAGDVAEANALRRVFDGEPPPFASTKSLGGHALGAAGALEAAHSLLMMRHGFLAPSVNVESPDAAVDGLDLVRELRRSTSRVHLSNSFGFGGTNATLVLGAAPPASS